MWGEVWVLWENKPRLTNKTAWFPLRKSSAAWAGR